MVEKYGDLGANSGSREPSRVSPSRPIGFDPERMEARLAELLALEFNWNSYHALPIDQACVDRVRRFYPIMETLGLQPWITPDNDGGLIIERGGTDDYSVDFDPSGTASVYFDGLTDADAWALVGLFAQLKALDAIAAAARERGDAKQAPSEGPQSGAESASPDPQTDNHP